MVARKRRNEALARASLTEEDYLAAAKAASTRAEYAKDLKYFIKGGGSIPATVNQVIEHITDMATWLAVATIEKRLVSLHIAHLEQGCRSPVHHPRVKQLMKGVRRSLGVAQRQVKAVGKGHPARYVVRREQGAAQLGGAHNSPTGDWLGRCVST